MLRIILLALLCLVGTTTMYAKGPLSLTADPWPPFVIEQKGPATGVDVDIVTELAKRVGTTMQVSIAPWKRCLFHIQEGQADIISHLSYRKSRESFVYYLRPAYFEHDYKVFFIHEKNSAKVNTLADLKGLRVGIIRGAVYGEEFDAAIKKGDIEVFQANTLDTLIKMVDAKRIDGFINTLAPAKHAIAKLGLQDSLKETNYKIVTDKNLYLGLSLKSSWYEKRKELEKALADMIADGTVAKIQKRYIE